VRYQPIPNEDGYVVDWTHEREWRCRVITYHDARFGNTPTEGVPLLLPAVYNYEQGRSVYYLPKVLVRRKNEKETVEEIIKELSPEWMKACQNSYLKGHFELLPRANIIALNELENDTEAVKLDWIILEKNS